MITHELFIYLIRFLIIWFLIFLPVMFGLRQMYGGKKTFQVKKDKKK